MEKRDENRFIVVRGVVHFLRDHRARLGEICDSEGATTLESILAETERLREQQLFADGEYSRYKALVDELTAQLMLRYFDPIASVAAYRSRVDGPKDWEGFSKPDPKRSVMRFAGRCHDAARFARQREASLLRWSVSLDGVEEMIDALEQAHTSQGLMNAHGHGATAAIPRILGPARKVINAVGDLIEAKCSDDPALLAAWETTIALPKIQPRRLVSGGPLALPAGETVSEERLLPATTGETASVKLIVTTSAKQLPPSRTQLSLPSGLPSLVRTIRSRISGPFQRLAELMRGSGPKGSDAPPSSSDAPPPS
jgi:hypothetical protein